MRNPASRSRRIDALKLLLRSVSIARHCSRCLSRGGELAGKDGGAVAVKVAKEKHDMRFDIPCIGSRTLEICASTGVSVLALEAGKTLLLDEEEVREFVSKHNIALTTVT